MKKIILVLSFFFIIAGNVFAHDESLVPKSLKDERREKMGNVFSEKSVSLSGGKEDKKHASVAYRNGLNANSYLWQASIDVISFMPIDTSDSSGGIISTDWYEDPEIAGERFKVNVFIKSNELKPNALQVTVFKQELKEGIWRSVKASSKISEDLEEKTFTRARELKLASQH